MSIAPSRREEIGKERRDELKKERHYRGTKPFGWPLIVILR
jgi:hypothetical protein